jgi:hypothetical protein
MAFSVFVEKSSKPGDDELAKVLGRASALWIELKKLIAQQHDPVAEEWVYSGKNYGWSLRLKQKKRAVMYMTPGERFFRVAYAFGEKAVQAALQSDLPASVLDLINSAPKYPEGRGIRMEVKTKEDVRMALKLAEIKMAN